MWEPQPDKGDNIKDSKINIYRTTEDNNSTEESAPSQADFKEPKDGNPDIVMLLSQAGPTTPS